MPPTAAAAVALAKSSRASTLGSRAWTCVSITPGRTTSPSASTRSRPVGQVGVGADRDDPALRDRQSAASDAVGRHERAADDDELGLHGSPASATLGRADPVVEPDRREDRVEVGDRAGVEDRARRPHALGGDRAATPIQVLADREVEPRLVLEPDERQRSDGSVSRAPASSPDRKRPTISTRSSGNPNPVIVPTAPRRSSSSSMIAPRPPRTRTPGAAASSRPTLGGLGSSSSLTTRHDRRTLGDRGQQVDGHVDAAARRMVLDDDRQVDGLGDREVVGQDRRVVGPRQCRRGEHHRVGAHRLRLPARTPPRDRSRRG